MPHNEAQRISDKHYSPDYLEGGFADVSEDTQRQDYRQRDAQQPDGHYDHRGHAAHGLLALWRAFS